MRIAAKFSIILNNQKLNDGSLALAYIKQLKPEVDNQLIQQQITQNYNQIIQHFRKDPYQLAQFVKYAQRITQNPLDSYQQYLLYLIKARFPSKPFLLQCLQLNSEFNVEVLQTMPNTIQEPLIHAALNYLICNHTLDYKESTSVLHFLHNKKVLKQLLQCNWVQNYIKQSKQGLEEPNLKNLALLSRIYADISHGYLFRVAQALEKMNLEQQPQNQLSYVTLYQHLSVLKNKKDLLQKITAKLSLNQKTDDQELMQLLIGVAQSKDKHLAQLLFNLIKHKEIVIKNEDQVLYYLTGTYFKLLNEQKIQDEFKEGAIFELIKKMNPKQLGEFCMNLKNNYSINLVSHIKENPTLIDPQNVVNFFLLDETKILNLTSFIKQCLKDKTLDLGGIMQLSFHSEFKKDISESILTYKFEEICYNVKELSSILLNVDQIVEGLGTLVDDSIKAVNLDMSNAEGLGNLLYLEYKRIQSKNVILPEKVLIKIIQQCDAIELINFLKGLSKQSILTSDLQAQITEQIKKKVNDKNRLRLSRTINKLPKQLQFSLD